MSANSSGGRLVALDGLRGVCAILVVMFHFRAPGILASLPFVRHGWLFVDFFFVLSGAIITINYLDRIRSVKEVRAFLLLRLARVYPLHVFMLTLFLIIELASMTGLSQVVGGRAPFSSPNTISQFFASLFLLNTFGLFDTISWNGPSWSISAEFWAYVFFAAVIALFRRYYLQIFFISIVITSMIIFSIDDGLDLTSRYGVIRCLFGFCLGGSLAPLFRFGLCKGSFWEFLCCILSIVFVSMASSGSVTLLGPPLFAILVLTFANGSGLISKLLLTTGARKLGDLSYSIYMVHIFVQARLYDTASIVQKLGGIHLISRDGGAKHLTMQPLLGDVTMIGMIALVLGISSLTYRWIEMPPRRWARDWVKRHHPTMSAPSPLPAAW